MRDSDLCPFCTQTGRLDICLGDLYGSDIHRVFCDGLCLCRVADEAIYLDERRPDPGDHWNRDASFRQSNWAAVERGPNGHSPR